tara:strand:- start:1502 stop:2125 length:624 start_codon:yes stop_codon:yes gene_type:complete
MTILVILVFVVSNDNIYESLYKSGYHSNLRLSHANSVIRRLHQQNVSSVLDLGCSHGYAVAALWKKGIQANGVDIAPTAIKLASKVRGQGRCGEDPCFQTANATALPFRNKHFSTLISTDVLEHLAPQDVDNAILEMIRVTRSDMWLKIAVSTERNKAPLEKLHTKNMHKDVLHLHTTLMNLDAWMKRFLRFGVSVTKKNDLLHVVI